jgi:hypothetical protein
MAPKGKILFGYFFGPKIFHLPIESDVEGLDSIMAVLTCRFGDLGLYGGEWPIICHSSHWERNLWPLPEFVRVDVISGKAKLIRYSEDDVGMENRQPIMPA